MRKELSQIIGVEKPVIDKLFDLGFIDATMVNAYLIYKESIAMKEKHPELSKHKIHNELAAKHNVSPASVYKWCRLYDSL